MGNAKERCYQSWIYATGPKVDGGFSDVGFGTRYIFSYYWIFEVVTTVGYGDYSGGTTNEWIFSIFLEFLGLTFFAILMGQIGQIFDVSNIDDMIEVKYDELDMWIRKIETSS